MLKLHQREPWFLLLSAVFLLAIQVPLSSLGRFAPSDALLAPAALASSSVLAPACLRRSQATAAIWLGFIIGYGMVVLAVAGATPTTHTVIVKFLGAFVLALYASVGYTLATAGRRDSTLRIMLAGVVLFNVLGYVEAQFGLLRDRGFIWDRGQLGRHSGLLVDSNANAGLLALAIAVGIFLRRRGELSPSYTAISVGACSFFFVISYSRSAWVACAVAALVTAVQQSARFRFFVAIVAVPVGVMMTLYWERIWATAQVATGGSSNRPDTVSSRLDTVSVGWDAFVGRPLFGTGAGYILEESGEIVHNSYLWILLEFGAVGALWLAGLIWVVAGHVSRLLDRDLRGLFVFGLLNFAVLGMAIEVLYQRSLWLMIGLLCGAVATERNSRLAVATERERARGGSIPTEGRA